MGRSFPVLIVIFSALSYNYCALAQDAALRDRVASLVEKLSNGTTAERDQAEAALTKLGSKARDLIPSTFPLDADQDAKKRLQKLRDAASDGSPTIAKVTIQGTGIRLSDALKQLQSKTGNVISDLREAYGGDASNPTMELDLNDVTFFEALDEISEKAGVSLTSFTGDGSIGIMPYGAMEYGASPKSRPPVRYSGPFRISLNRIGSVRDFSATEARTNVQFEVAWEPKLRPMLLSLKADKVRVIDDRGESVTPEIRDESTSTVLRPENPAAELNLNLKAPARVARSLKELTLEATVTVPAGLKRFQFPKLEQFEVEDNLWKLQVKVTMPAGSPVFETYRQGLFNNRIWLQKPDGTRFEQNGGFSTLGAPEGSLAFEYLFVDAPGKPSDWGLVYETPGKVEEIPFSITFENVDLP